MYYYFPEQEGAYPVSMDENLGQNPSTRQFFFGDALLIAPVTAASTASTCVQSPEPELSAAAVFVSASGSRGSAYPPASRSHDAPCGLTEMDVWLPPGSWFEIHTGQLLSGSPSAGTNRSLQVHLDDVPVYAKGGSVVPRRPLPRGDGLSSIGLANAPYEKLEWTIYPGSASGEGLLYEDDGQSYDYLQGSYATSKLEYSRGTASGGRPSLNVSIAVQAATAAALAVLPPSRAHTIRLPNALPPASVLVNGTTPLSWSRYGGAGTWWYDGSSLELVVSLPQSSTALSDAVSSFGAAASQIKALANSTTAADDKLRALYASEILQSAM